MPNIDILLVLGSINALLAWSMWLPIASGQISFGTAGAAAVGGYTVAWLNLHSSIGPLERLAAGAVTGAIGLLLAGLIGLRVKGFALGVVTLGLSEIVVISIGLLPGLGGPAGLAGLALLDHAGQIAFGAVVLAFIASWLVYRRPLGRDIDVVAMSEMQASALGIRTRHIQIGAFAMSGAAAGLAGGLMVAYSGFVDPSTFGLALNVSAFSAVIIGGVGVFSGPFLGAFALSALLESTLFKGNQDLVIGIVLVLAVLLRRDGLIRRSKQLQRLRVQRLVTSASNAKAP